MPRNSTPPGTATAPAVGREVVERPPQIARGGVGGDGPPARQQPFQCRLEQVLAVGATARERDRDVQQVLAVLGEEPLQLRMIRITSHAAASLIHAGEHRPHH
jgi:hypothetical protein